VNLYEPVGQRHCWFSVIVSWVNQIADSCPSFLEKSFIEIRDAWAGFQNNGHRVSCPTFSRWTQWTYDALTRVLRSVIGWYCFPLIGPQLFCMIYDTLSGRIFQSNNPSVSWSNKSWAYFSMPVFRVSLKRIATYIRGCRRWKQWGVW
jgi:hypothetical protein